MPLRHWVREPGVPRRQPDLPVPIQIYLNRKRQQNKTLRQLQENRVVKLLLALLLAIALRWGLLQYQRHFAQKQVLIIPDPLVANDPRFHDLSIVAQTLEQEGFRVAHMSPDGFLEAEKDSTKDPELWACLEGYDIIVSQGDAARAVSDYAARANVPIVRFVADIPMGATDGPNAVMERPEIIVLGFVETAQVQLIATFRYAKIVELLTAPEVLSNRKHPAFRRLVAHMQELIAQRAGTKYDFGHGILGLVMITKNEANRMNATMAAVKEHIDYWLLLDTGSNDTTIDQMYQGMWPTPGEAHLTKFIDFSISRNTALQLYGERTKYALMLDADMVLHNAWRLRVHLQRVAAHCAFVWAPFCVAGFKIHALYDGNFFETTRVFPTQGIGTDAGWHYSYPVMELPEHNGEGRHVPLPTANLTVGAHPDGRYRSRERDFDIPVLRAALARDPNSTRMAFFLGVTLHGVGDNEEALEALQHRIDLGGWYLERYECHLRRGRILFLLDRDPRADLIAAHHLSPYRAEPLVELSNWHANRAATRCFLLPKRPVTAAATAAVTGDTTDAVSLTGDVAKEVPTTGGGASGATGEEEDEEEAPVDSLCVLKHRAASWSYAKRALALPLPTRDTFFVETNVYEYRALESVAESGANIVYRLLGIGVVGRGAALALALHELRPDLYERGLALIRKLEALEHETPHDVRWLGI